MRVRLAILAFVVGCSFTHGADNVAASGDAQSVGGGGGGGGSGSGSGSGSAACVNGTRACADATHSGVCGANGQVTVDRDCPPTSTCSNGYCQPPTGAATCSVANGCSAGKECDLYVVGGSLTGYCTPTMGTQPPYQSCSTTGSDPGCGTGICANVGDTTTCLYLCSGSTSPCPPGSSLSCGSVTTTVEGVSASGLNGCFKD